MDKSIVSRSGRPVWLALVAVTLWSPPGAHSQQPEIRGQEEMVVTGRRLQQDSRQLIGQISRLGGEDIDRLGHTHIQELAVRLPGVWLSRGNGQEHLTAVRSPVYTGAGSCGEVLVAEASIPTRPSGLCNVNQLFEVNSEQAGSLEVWRGAGTVFYGSNAVHGVINSLPPAMGQQYLALEAGPHDYYRSKLALGSDNAAGHAMGEGEQRWQLHANGVTDGGLKDDAGYDQQKLSLQHHWQGRQLSAETLLSLVNLNQETAGYLQGKGAYKRSGWKTNPNPEAYRDAWAGRLSSRLRWQTAGGAEWQFTPYLRSSEMEFLQHFLPGQPTEQNGQQSAGFQLGYRRDLSESWRLWSGLDGEWADMWVQERQQAVFIAPDNARYQGSHYDFEVQSQQWAAFMNLEWTWRPEAVLELGWRWETLHYDYDNRLPDGSLRDDNSACAGGDCRYLRPADREDRFTNLSAHLGGRWQLSEQWQLYGRLARAYRAPQINERYRLQAGQSVDEFDEKTVDSLELGLRFQGAAVEAELSAYHMRKEDQVLSASNNATVGDGETRHSGLELAAHYSFSRDWKLLGSASWARHRIRDASLLNGMTDVSGNDMDTAPEWMASLHLQHRPAEHWWLELQAVHMGEYYLDTENQHRYPGHTLLNAVVKWQPLPHWSARLRLHNLTDRRYAERADYAFGNYRYFTGENRAAYLEVRRDF